MALSGLVAASVLMIAACTGTANTATGTTATGNGNAQTFTIASDDIVDTLDPAVASTQPELQFAMASYETLVNYDSTTKKLVPSLATSWSASADAETFTFHIRSGVKFHDGSTLTAAGTIVSLQRTISVGKGESSLITGIKSMSAPSSDTLVIQLKVPNADFVYELSRIFIMSAKAIAAHKGSDNGQQWWAQHEDGTGPYVLKTFEPNEQLVLQKFPQYWRGWAGHHVSTYVINVVAPSAQVLQMQQGTADMATAVPNNDAYTERTNPSLSVKIYPGSPFYLLFNTQQGPFKNVLVRHAVSLAVNYKEINSDIMYGWGSALSGPVPSWASDQDTALATPAFNLTEAKSLLTQAGYGPSNPLKFSFLYFNGWSFEQTIATALQASLQQIGVDMTVTGAPWASYTQRVEDPTTRPDMGSLAVYVPTPSPGPLLASSFDPASEGQWSYWGYNNPQFTSLLTRAENATNTSTQQSLFDQAQALLVSDYAGVWLMEMPDMFVIQKDVQGLTHDPSWGLIPDYYGLYKSTAS
jgi:peptide/nickel transport system substrate-binding protein